MVQIREALRDDIVAEMRKVSDALSSGRAADFADYKRMVGTVQGLSKALEQIDARFNKLFDDGGD
jgi:hypothetical protein